MLDLLVGFPSQIKEAMRFPVPKIDSKIDNIVICGMGGSAIAGDILKHCLQDEINIPITVVKDYTLPRFVGKNTLLLVISYSGNTEETISAFNQGRKKKAKIIGITSNGKLKKICKPCIIIPEGMPPRGSIAYLFFPILRTLSNSGIIGNRDKEINEMIRTLQSLNRKEAEMIAARIKGRIPVIYSSRKYAPLAYRLKTQINENAKQFAAAGAFPEVNHNEIEVRFDSRFAIILFQDTEEDKRVRRQVDAFRKVVPMRVNEIRLKGKTSLSKLFYGIYFGDWISYYLARLYKVDLSKTERIDEVKRLIRK